MDKLTDKTLSELYDDLHDLQHTISTVESQTKGQTNQKNLNRCFRRREFTIDYEIMHFIKVVEITKTGNMKCLIFSSSNSQHKKFILRNETISWIDNDMVPITEMEFDLQFVKFERDISALYNKMTPLI